jgi:CBS domain-containing protein
VKSVKAIIGNREMVSVDPSASVLSATRAMTDHQIGAVPIVDADRLVGVFTERDVMARVVAAGLDAAVTPVADVMSTQLVVADVNEPYEVCLPRMQQAGVRHLIVLDQGRLAGILSFRDVLAVEVDEKAEAITLLNAYVDYIPADIHAKTHT